MSKDNFFIKKDYKAREKLEIKSGEYWSKSKIADFNFFQNYPAYNYCKKFIKKKRNINSVLDIGCGDALKLTMLIKSVCPNVYGIDEEPAVQFIKKFYGLNTFYSDDINKPTLDLGKKFDLIISIDVIEHLIKPDNLISLIKKHTHNNTFIILSTPERDILRGSNCYYSPRKKHIREWNKVELNNYLRYHKLIILEHNIIKLTKFIHRWSKPKQEIKRLINNIKKFIFIRRFKRVKHTQIVLCKVGELSNLPMMK